MSTLIDELSKLDEQSPEPMGFGTASKSSRRPSVLIIGTTKLKALARKPKMVEAKVDAVLIEIDGVEERLWDKALSHIGNIPWGIRSHGISNDSLDKLIKQGCDFLIFEAKSSDASILNRDDLGKVIVVEPGIDRDKTAAINSLALDAVLYENIVLKEMMTIGDIFDLSRVKAQLGIPILVSTSRVIIPSEIEPLREVGTAAILTSLAANKRIEQLKDQIDSLPSRKKDRRLGDALLPKPEYGFSPPSEDDFDEDE